MFSFFSLNLFVSVSENKSRCRSSLINRTIFSIQCIANSSFNNNVLRRLITLFNMQIDMEAPNLDYQDPPPKSWTLIDYLCVLVNFCCLFFWIVGLLVIIIWWCYFSITTPKDPKFQLDSASMTSLEDVIGPNFTVKFDITFSVTNPNKKHISYDIIVVSLDNSFDCEYQYGFCSGLLASTSLTSFSQLSKSKDKLPVQINVVGQSVGENIVAARARGSIEFGLKLYARFTIASKHGIEVDFYCKRLSFVYESNNANLASGSCLNRDIYLDGISQD